VSRGFYLGPGICSCNRKTTDAHYRQVDDVVAHVGDLVEGKARPPNHVHDCLCLEVLPLVDKFEFQVTGADRNSLRLALRDDAGSQAAKTCKRDAKSVMRMETLDFDSRAIEFGNHGDITICQDTVHVEEKDFDLACACLEIFKNHGAMIQAREEEPNLRRGRICAGILFAVLILGVFGTIRHATANVAFMGDSLTQGWSFPRVNLGLYGQTTGQMLARFPRQIDTGSYREVIILGGTDDILGGTKDILLALNRDVTLHNLGSMVDDARAHSVAPVLALIPPIYRGNGAFLPAVRSLDQGIMALGRRKGVPVVDYYSVLEGQRAAYSDGVHLKRRGYLRMEWALLKSADLF